jgi:beta-glucosidase
MRFLLLITRKMNLIIKKTVSLYIQQIKPMKNSIYVFFIFMCMLCSLAKAQNLPVYKDRSQSVSVRVSDLLGRMTLEEKTLQMQDLFFSDLMTEGIIDTAKTAAALKSMSFGSITGPNQTVAQLAANVNRFREYIAKNNRLGIPVLCVAEALHGLTQEGATIFPQAIAMGSTFNPLLIKNMAGQIAAEAKSAGVDQVLSPNLDLARELRWGRVEETFGEDPYLAGQMGVAYIKGCKENEIICTPKHFVAHGSPLSGLNLASVAGGEYDLHSVYLKPFADAIRETDVLSIMNAYSSYNGVPIAASRRLMTDVLRGELGFRGYVSSDWTSIDFLYSFHHVAANTQEAARMAVLAGIDCEVAGNCYDHLTDLVKKGLLSENDIDTCVRRILTVKFEAGLFDRDKPIDIKLIDEKVHNAIALNYALRVARESAVLLKNNNNLLPLNVSNLKSIAVIGPNAGRTQFGDYTWTDDGSIGVNPLQGIRNFVGEAVRVNYAQGCDIWSSDESGIAEAVKVAKKSDVAVVFLGTASAWPGLMTRNAVSGESYDLSSIELPGVQERLLKAIAATGKPVVLVLVAGKPVAIPWAKANIPAIVCQWYAGELQGQAIAEILFGKVNPSGKLNVSFPQSTGHLPVYYNHLKTDRGFYHNSGSPDRPGRDYVFANPDPLWAFGHGLSYTTFSYDSLYMPQQRFSTEDTVKFQVAITNTGTIDGSEVVQVYIADPVSSVVTPVRELKRFQKIDVPSGESREMQFLLPISELAVYDPDGRWKVEPGDFEIQVGTASDSILLKKTLTVYDLIN